MVRPPVIVCLACHRDAADCIALPPKTKNGLRNCQGKPVPHIAVLAASPSTEFEPTLTPQAPVSAGPAPSSR